MLFAVLLFIVVPILELYVIIQVGGLIGIWPTLALLLLDSVLGAFVLRHEGRGAWRRFNEALGQGRFPGTEVVDGLLIVIGGTLLLTPGFLTDIVGLFFLVPPTRALVRAVLKRTMIGRVAVVGLGGGGPFRPGSGPEQPSRHYDYDVSAEEEPASGDASEPRLPRSES